MDGVVGRTAELTAVLGVLDRAASGPAGLHLVGEPGVGKTTLLRAATDAARERGFTTLVAVGEQSDETAMPYAVLADLLAAAPRDVDLPEVQRNALDALLVHAPVTGEVDQRAVVAATATVLRNAAPLALVVDDLQWADAGSRAVLTSVLRRADDVRVAVVTAARPGDGDAPLPLGLLAGNDLVAEITLRGLDVAGTAALVETRLGTHVSPPTAAELHATTLGNPLLTLEIARLMASGETGVLRDTTLPVPDRLQRALKRRIDALPPDSREVVAVVAAAGTADEDLVAAALPTTDVRNAVAIAAEQGVLDVVDGRLRVFHPLARAVVLNALDDARLRHLHAMLADVVTDPFDRARHLVGATREPDENVATTVAEAALDAARRGAPGAAARLYDDAAILTPDASRAAERRSRSGEMWLAAGDATRAVDVLREAIAMAPPDVVSTVRCALGRALNHRDGSTAALPDLREALAAATTPAQRATALRELAAATRLTDGPRAALVFARDALALAEQTDDAGLVVRCVSVVAVLEFTTGLDSMPGLLERGITLEERHGRRDGQESPRTVALFQAMWRGRLDEARERGEALLAEVDPATPAAVYPLYLLGLTEWRAGRWDRAADLSDRALDLVEQCGWSDPGCYVWLRGLAHAVRGEHADALRCATRAAEAADASGESIWADHAAGLTGFVALAEGDVAKAIEPLRRGCTFVGAQVPGTRLWLADYVEVLTATGHTDEAEELLAPYEAETAKRGDAAPRAVVARCRALIHAASGDLDAAIETLSADPRTSPEAFQVARNDLVLGTLLRRARRRRDAAEVLRRAESAFDQLGAPVWSAKARAETERLGKRTAMPDDLTPTEAAVSRLVAAGRSNKEVAGDLSISVKTVEWTLTRVYRKLGVTSRAALAALKSGDSPGPPRTARR